MGFAAFYGIALGLNGMDDWQAVWLEERVVGIFLADNSSRSMGIFSSRPHAAYAGRWALREFETRPSMYVWNIET